MAHKFDYVRNDPTSKLIQDFIDVAIIRNSEDGSKCLGIEVFTDLASFRTRLELAFNILFTKEFCFVIKKPWVKEFVERVSELSKD